MISFNNVTNGKPGNIINGETELQFKILKLTAKPFTPGTPGMPGSPFLPAMPINPV